MSDQVMIEGLKQVYFFGSLMALLASIFTYKIVGKK